MKTVITMTLLTVLVLLSWHCGFFSSNQSEGTSDEDFQEEVISEDFFLEDREENIEKLPDHKSSEDIKANLKNLKDLELKNKTNAKNESSEVKGKIWIEKCREDMPDFAKEFCTEIQTEAALQCVKFLETSKSAMNFGQFQACGGFRETAEVKCLEKLNPRNIVNCIGVTNDRNIRCIKIAGFTYKRECTKIHESAGVTCVQVLFDRNWLSNIEICQKVSEQVEIGCMKDIENEDDLIGCHPWRFSSKGYTLCKGYRDPLELEIGRKNILNIKGPVIVAYADMAINVDPGFRMPRGGVQIIRTTNLTGKFYSITGQGPYTLVYRDTGLHLEETGHGSTTIDRRSEKYRGDISNEEYFKHCVNSSKGKNPTKKPSKK